MPKGGVRPKATCHPDRPHFSKGLCESCYSTEYRKAYYSKNKRKILADRREYVKEHRPHLMERYGISPQQYKALLAQQGGCAICGREDSGHKKNALLCVDHDHKTGVVRGLLCDNCNVGLGRFKDDPELLASAIRYLHCQQARRTDVG